MAGCDKEILGKTLTEGDFEVKVNERFYGGEVVNAEELLDRIKEATIINIIGDRIVGIAVEKGFVEEEKIKNVCGVKHAQIITVD